MGLKSVAFILLTFLGQKSSVESVIIPLVMIGVGHGFFSSPNLNSVMGSVGREKLGIAAGTMGTIRQAAQSIGISIMGGLIVSQLPSGSLNLYGTGTVLSSALASDFVVGMRLAFFAGCIFCAIGVLTSLMRGKTTDAISVVEKTDKMSLNTPPNRLDSNTQSLIRNLFPTNANIAKSALSEIRVQTQNQFCLLGI